MVESRPEGLGSKLHRLATSIVAGDVVFFIGAGFSVESEGNTASVLIARLLVRFEGVTAAVAAETSLAGSPLAALCEDLRSSLQSTFQVKPDRDGVICGKFFTRNLRKLTPDYYLINDWMCSAFDALLRHPNELQGLRHSIEERERGFAQNFAGKKSSSPLRLTPADYSIYQGLISIDPEPLMAAGQGTAGKALFLDTMGFNDPAVMAGDPFAQFDLARRSYADRLRDRHSTLAWLALERALPIVLTTNYDMLLEGGYRMAGMLGRTPHVDAASSGLEWNRRLRFFTPISEAAQFFTEGDGFASALIVKIHGCVHSYREHREKYARARRAGAGPEALRTFATNWRRVLRTTVFTFREIQNWREDSWSRDYIRTLLRTRTVAFAGYSTADPVMHDTFRSVYEEMTRYRLSTQAQTSPSAFFFQFGPKTEFHGIEILRAASRAAGEVHPDLGDHPNLVRYTTPGQGFPSVDEAMIWIFHFAYRQLQQQALQSELRRVGYQLFGHPAPEQETLKLISDFSAIVDAEIRASDDLHTSMSARDPDALARVRASRRQLGDVVSWTVAFHRNLMREYAAADLILRRPEGARSVRNAIRWPWYAPLNDHPDWAAWAVVLELAIRRRGAAWLERFGVQRERLVLEPVATDRTAILIPSHLQLAPAAPRVCLSVELPQLREASERPRAFRIARPIVWELRSHTVPWWVANDRQRPFSTPGPRTLWLWAIGAPASGEVAADGNTVDFFGDQHGGNARPGDRDHDPTADEHAPDTRAASLPVSRRAVEI